MAEMPERFRPRPLPGLRPEEREAERELLDLAQLADAGLPVTTVVVVPADAEERFYRLNNLPRQLLLAFARVDPADPDEDDVEEAVPEARRLVRTHFLLDEFIDAFYDATAGLAGELRVRRGGEEGERAVRGRPALLALKHAFERDWTLDAVMARLERSHAIALDARPVLVHEVDVRDADDELVRRASEVLGRPVRLRLTAGGEAARVLPGVGEPAHGRDGAPDRLATGAA